jgi:hypothetical protein
MLRGEKVDGMDGAHRVLADVDVNLATRIFISHELSELDVRKKWASCVEDYMSSHDKVIFKSTFQSIRTSLVDAAMRKPN